MKKPTKAEMATSGIATLRRMLKNYNYDHPADHDNLSALCDYAEAQIEARRRGGKRMTAARIAANKRNASQPRKPRCRCGKMTTEAAKKSGHTCA